MDRRSFFKWLSAAPVALPMAAVAVSQSAVANGGLMPPRGRPYIVGESAVEYTISAKDIDTLAVRRLDAEVRQQSRQFNALVRAQAPR